MARLRSSWPTIIGMIDWAEVSNSVSPMPRAKAMTYSIHSWATSAMTRRAIAPISTARPASTSAMVRRRSSRSARAPAWRANSSHGSREATATPAIKEGDRVSVSASNGRATWKTPSARLERPDETQTFR